MHKVMRTIRVPGQVSDGEGGMRHSLMHPGLTKEVNHPTSCISKSSRSSSGAGRSKETGKADDCLLHCSRCSQRKPPNTTSAGKA